MSATYPPVFTPIVDAELDLNAPVSEEVVRKIAQNLNMLSKLAFVGSYRAVHLQLSGSTVPSTGQFQLCNGSEIVDSTSPLSTQGSNQHFTPNLINKYIRVAGSTSSNGTVGADSNNLEHDHGGLTGAYIHQQKSEEDGPHSQVYNHYHSISKDLSPAEIINPPYMNTVFYLKIN